MNFLLDTNVISEWTRPRPNPQVIQWLADADEDRTFLSVVTIAELGYGIERMQPGKRRKQLHEWLQDELPQRFKGRVFPVTTSIAESWGKLLARTEAIGRPMAAMDAFLAATANVHELILVTRNASDFETVVSSIINPWR